MSDALAERLAWQLACQGAFRWGYTVDSVDPNGPPVKTESLVIRVLRLHNGTERGEQIVGRGHTTNDATHDLKAKLLERYEARDA